MLRHPVRACLVILLLAMAAERASFAAKAETWIRVRSPDFIVLTDANEKDGRRVAYQFETIRVVFRLFFNISGSTKDPPIIIIAVKNEEGLKPLLPEYWAKKGSLHPAGFYVGGPEKSYVALRLDATLRAEGDEPFEPIYHEYVHFLTRRMMSRLPLWMVEGLAEFYGNTRIEGEKVAVGAPSRSNLRILRQTPLLPLDTLFAVNVSSPFYHEENKASIFYAESWALTHYLLTRDWREGTHHVTEFVHLLGQGVGPEEAARQTIGEPDRLQKDLAAYINKFAFTVARLNVSTKVDSKEFQAEPASEAESLALRADFMAHDRHYQEAQEMLEGALKLDPNLAAAYESLAFIFSQQGKTEEATQWYSKAVALNSQSYLANFYYAVSLLKGMPDDESAAKAESSLRAAIKIAPDFAPAYSALGWLLASRHKNLEEAHRLILTAVNLEPGNVHYRLNAVQVLEAMGRGDDAVRAAKLAASMAKTPDEQAEAAEVLSLAEQYQENMKRVKEQEEAFKKAPIEAPSVETSQTNPAEEPAPASQAVSGSAQTSSEPPKLRHREATPSGGPTSPSPPVPFVMRAHAPRPEVLASRKVAEGTIQSSICPGVSTLEITLDSAAGVLHLYSDDYLKIPFSAINFKPEGILDPCTSLSGHYARITYRPAKGQSKQGEIVAVGLMVR
jgi:tetratricopeptide (TPR) repeat protein